MENTYPAGTKWTSNRSDIAPVALHSLAGTALARTSSRPSTCGLGRCVLRERQCKCAPHSPHLRFGAGVRAACTVPHTVSAVSPRRTASSRCPSGGLRGPNGVSFREAHVCKCGGRAAPVHVPRTAHGPGGVSRLVSDPPCRSSLRRRQAPRHRQRGFLPRFEVTLLRCSCALAFATLRIRS